MAQIAREAFLPRAIEVLTAGAVLPGNQPRAARDAGDNAARDLIDSMFLDHHSCLRRVSVTQRMDAVECQE
jgi:hypothetical protein